MSLVNIPLTPIPEDDIEKGLLEGDTEDVECICNLNECYYRAPCCRYVATGYVISSVVLCGGLVVTLFLAFLHIMNVF